MSLINRSLGAIGAFLRASPDTSHVALDSQGSTASPRSGNSASEEIPVLHRLVILYLMLPVLIWLVGWHRWWFGIPVAALLIFALWRSLGPYRHSFSKQALSQTWRSALRPATLILLFVALVWVMATAAGGIFDINNGDWPKHRAVLLELSRNAWPVYLPSWLSSLSEVFPEGVEPSWSLLRYFLGYYMVPGLIGNWLGPAALNWAVPLWTWCGIALMVSLFTRGLVAWRAAAATVLFIFFSGMDVLALVMFEGWEWFEPSFAWNGWPWISLGPNDFGHEFTWNIEVHYFSNLFSLMWTPQHFIAGGLFALLVVQLWENRRFLAISAVVVCASVFWSPFIAVSLLPLVAVSLAKNGIWPFLRWQNLLLSPPLFAILLTYLSAGTEGIRRNWLWEKTAIEYVLEMLPTIYLVEFLLLAILLVILRPRLLREPFFIACLLTLLLLPWYSFGEVNDLVMRGLIPPLVLLSYFTAHTLLKQRPYIRPLRSWDALRAVTSALIVLVLGLGAFGGLIHLTRANNEHDLQVYGYEQFGPKYTIDTVVSQAIVSQYLTKQVPDWYRSVLGDEPKMHAPTAQELIGRFKFDVHLIDGNIIVFARSPCTSDDRYSRFIVQVFQTVELDVVQMSTRDFNFSQGYGSQAGDTCVTSRAIPEDGFDRIRFGQYNPDQTGHSWLGNYFTKDYRDRLLSEAGEPIIRAKFDVYVKKKELVYSRRSCGQDDVGAQFFLRVTPVDVNALDEDRRSQGFEEIIFQFHEVGGRIGDDCLAIIDLPVYSIWNIQTGQHHSREGIVWEGEAALPQPEANKLMRHFDESDGRVFAYDAEMRRWRHVPDVATFQSMGFYWCDVTVAEAGFFEHAAIGPPYPTSNTPERADYPSCRS